MTKYYLCNEIATLKEHQRIRAEKTLHKRVAQWDGGDILNVVFDGEIQGRDWYPEEMGVYDTLEEAQKAAHAQNLKCSVIAYDAGLVLEACYIAEREVFDDGTWEESFGTYALPREVVEEEAPDKNEDIEAFTEYLYRRGYDACDIYKLRETYNLTEEEENEIYRRLQTLYNIDEWVLDKYYGKFRSF